MDERFRIQDRELCPALRWKGQFVLAEHDATVPPGNDGLFWCARTQTCMGPDSGPAEPGNCSSRSRACYGGRE
jgi:hypothetical protein